MKRMINLLSLCLLLGMTTVAHAETVSVSPLVLQQLNTISQALEEQQYGRAEQLLNKMAQQKLTPPEQAYLHQFRGNLALQKGQEREALKQFKAAWALDALTRQDQRQLLHTVGQLQMTLEQWKEGVASLERWMKQVDQ